MVDCIFSCILVFGDDVLQRTAQRRFDGDGILRRHRQNLRDGADDAVQPSAGTLGQHVFDRAVITLHALFHLCKDARAVAVLVDGALNVAALLFQRLLGLLVTFELELITRLSVLQRLLLLCDLQQQLLAVFLLLLQCGDAVVALGAGIAQALQTLGCLLEQCIGGNAV